MLTVRTINGLQDINLKFKPFKEFFIIYTNIDEVLILTPNSTINLIENKKQTQVFVYELTIGSVLAKADKNPKYLRPGSTVTYIQSIYKKDGIKFLEIPDNTILANYYIVGGFTRNKLLTDGITRNIKAIEIVNEELI